MPRMPRTRIPRRRKLRLPGWRRRAMKGYRIRRSLYPKNNEPTFVETFHNLDNTYGDFSVPAGAGIGKAFKIRITDVPQVSQYAQLYKQYRINWVKLIIVPDAQTDMSDLNASAYNQSIAIPFAGMCRVVHAVNDSPDVTAPATEAEVLEDNGCKVRTLKNKWSVSFKPVPDAVQSLSGGQSIYTRQKFRQWFNFDTVTTGNNPFHGAVSAYFTLPGGNTAVLKCNVYYKVSFSLRDPQ